MNNVNKNAGAPAKIEENKNVANPPLTTEPNLDPINARLDEMETNLKGTIERQNEVIEQQNKTIAELSKARSQNSIDDEEEGIILDRQSAHSMRLPVVNDAPVISGKLERVIGVQGLDYIMRVTTAETFINPETKQKEYKEYLFPFGCDVSRIDFSDERVKDLQTVSYENVATRSFKLQNVDTNDLTGASKVEKGKIVGEGGIINEIDRSSGRPVATGRKIRTVVRADVRYYTVEHDGEMFTISSDDLGNFRI